MGDAVSSDGVFGSEPSSVPLSGPLLEPLLEPFASEPLLEPLLAPLGGCFCQCRPQLQNFLRLSTGFHFYDFTLFAHTFCSR